MQYRTAAILAVALSLLITSCVPRYKQPMQRTTTAVPAGRFGAGTTTVTETPYESPGFNETRKALFARE